MMAEYIDRDLAEKALLQRCEETGYGGLNRDDIKMVMRTPWRIPSADVVPRENYKSMERTVDKLNKALAERKHGEWETVYLDQVYAGCRPRAIYCSNCHIVSAFKTPFCPNCGAEQREEHET